MATDPHSPTCATEEIDQQTARSVASVAHAGPEAIVRRLCELEREWTVGRLVKVLSGLCIFVGVGLGLLVDRAWFALPVIVGLLLLQYLIAPRSLLTSLFRAAGFRTSRDIEHERVALKALRGDFRHLPTIYDVQDRDALARLSDEGGLGDGPEPAPVDGKAVAHQVLDTLKH
jgi:hypothetical protein